MYKERRKNSVPMTSHNPIHASIPESETSSEDMMRMRMEEIKVVVMVKGEKVMVCTLHPWRRQWTCEMFLRVRDEMSFSRSQIR